MSGLTESQDVVIRSYARRLSEALVRIDKLEDENRALRVALSDERVARRRALRRALDWRREAQSQEHAPASRSS